MSELGLEPPTLHVKVRWLGRLIRAPPAGLRGRRPQGGPRTHWRNWTSSLDVAGDKDVWTSDKRQKMDG